MNEYKLTQDPYRVIRLSDNVIIPDVTANYGDALLYQAFLASGNIPDSADPAPVAPPNWNTLYGELLAGKLAPIFNDVNLKAIANPSIAVGLINVNSAIVTVRIEQALASGLSLLQLSGYVFSPEFKALWNGAIAELNFSDLVKL